MPSQPNFRIVAIIISGALFMTNLDGAIINTSLPQMAHDFGVPPVHMSVGVTAYLLSVAVFIPLSGWIADRFGPHRVFLAAIVIFVAASIGCGLSPNLTAFALARAAQGFGGALMAPVGRMVLMRNTEKADMLQAVALITWGALIAPVVGPALGGFITDYAGWRWNFLMNAVPGVIGFAAAVKFIPRAPATNRPLDFPGFLMAATGLVGLLYGLESLAHGTLPKGVSLSIAAVGAVSSVAAARHFRRVPNPLLDLASMKVRSFAAATSHEGLPFRICLHATTFLMPLMLQAAFGMSAFKAGLMMLAYFLGNLTMKPVATLMVRHLGFRTVLIGSGVLAGASLVACGLLQATTPTAVMLAVLVVAGFGRSILFTGVATLTFADTGVEQRNSAAILASLFTEVATVCGVALSAILLSASMAVRGVDVLATSDFRAAFFLVALLPFAGALSCLSLAKDVGSEVSGHRPRA